MNKHTPGPWSATGASGRLQINDATGEMIAVIRYLGNSEEAIASEAANARLMATAPDLLEALQVLLDSVEGNRVTVGDCNQARAAIARATGDKT
jgi:hypothetical protein